MRIAAICMMLPFAIGGAVGAAEDDLFPRPASLEPAIEFWTRVYTEVDTRSGFLHDSVHLDIVYDTLRFDDDVNARQRRRTIRRAHETYREILTGLATGRRDGVSGEAARVLALWPDDISAAELEAAARRLRFQLGQSDRFEAGLRRSGVYRDYIAALLRDKALPAELVVLPHVESSFDATAYSKVGAAGMWQFTRSTGLRYMRIDHIVDERRDPFISAHAAAQLLADNHAVIESWPLALTAYNHGLSGMRRAARQMGTKDIGVIAAKYDGPYFGFASRNFYPAFLAALDVDTNRDRYFPRTRLDPPTRTAVIETTDYVSAGALARALGVSLAQLKSLNPALMETVWENDKFVPKGFPLRVPAAIAGEAAARLADVPATERFAAQRPDIQHRVRRGDTLSEIAEQYGIGLSALLRANGLGSRDLIRIGQTLTLPVPGGAAPVSLAAAAEPPTADGEYIVRRGDTIATIARRVGMDADTLVAMNDLRDRNLIVAGQALRVAGGRAGDVADAAQAAAAAAADVPAATDMIAAADTPAPAPVDAAADVADDGPLLATAPDVGSEISAPQVTTAMLQESPAAAARPGVAPALLEAIAATRGASADAAAASAEAAADDVTAGTTVLESTETRLAADPSDYSVGEDGTIEVNSLETLGHYADWLQIRTQRLRDINDLAFGRAVVLGQRIRLDFSNVDAAAFEQRRLAYQEGIQEQFFSSYQIADVTDHIVRRGESLWLLAQRRYNVPVWLLRQYNPDVDLDRVRPGTVIKFPELAPIAG